MLQAYWVVLIVRALLGWVPALNGPWTGFVMRLTEPVLAPVNRLIPPIAGFSIAYIVVLIAVRAASSFFAQQAYACRYGLGG